MAQAGWYEDTRNPEVARWHDGTGWTDHTMVRAQWPGPGAPPPPTDPPATAAPPAPDSPPVAPARRYYTGWHNVRRSRQIATVVIAIGVLVAVVAQGHQSHHTSDASTSSSREDGFFNDLNLDRSVNDLDDSNISDATMLAGGHQFCDELTAAADDQTDPYITEATPEDFDRIAESLARTRFAAAKGTVHSDANAQIIVAYSVGQAAINNLCPEHTDALG